jgi:hypothetical protein
MRLGVVLEAFLDRTLDDTLDFVARGAPQITDLEIGVGGFAPTPHCDVAVRCLVDALDPQTPVHVVERLG